MDNYLVFLINASMVYYFHFLFFLIPPVVCTTGIALGYGLWATSILFFCGAAGPGETNKRLSAKPLRCPLRLVSFSFRLVFRRRSTRPKNQTPNPGRTRFAANRQFKARRQTPSPSLLSGAAHTR